VAAPNLFQILHQDIVNCGLCPRLRAHCAAVAKTKRRAYRDEDYWGKPVPGFGDPDARLLIVGLAPGAHGANRTGRMFTGDKSGDFLYAALHHTGFASQPESRRRDDGLALQGAYIAASARCAPPDNKPLPAEIRACRPFLERELKLLGNLRAVVALGRIAHDNYLETIGEIRSRFPFAHGRVHPLQPPLIDSYHPSQQNTSTGRLTRPMLQAVFETARRLIR
jgi:uracil-DNA glycosylase family 4